MQIQTSHGRESRRDGTSLARGLGWFSIGLGLAELAMPRLLSRSIGIDTCGNTASTMRLMGLREIAAGIGIFARPSHPLPMWNRVAGDVIDMALLAWAFKDRRLSSPRLLAAMASVAGVGALDVLAAQRLTKAEGTAEPIVKAITINRSPTDVYAHWRDLSSLRVYMRWLDTVEELGEDRSRWVAKLPTGNTIEWEARITEDIPGQRIAWEAIGKLGMCGSVDFIPAPGGRGTEVHVKMWVLTGGRFGVGLAKLIAGPQIGGDLRRFKQVLETGEVVKSDASIHKGMHPARPSQTPGEYEYEANRATMFNETPDQAAARAGGRRLEYTDASFTGDVSGTGSIPGTTKGVTP